ncbi:hypothetical protein L218DRAFT_975810 [Marasmius fiardii PR-910]|nr:hypothetical protein L218DRAFT_975810 [Marasmius fiardii PR-910]
MKTVPHHENNYDETPSVNQDIDWDQFLCYPTPASEAASTPTQVGEESDKSADEEDYILYDVATSTTFYPGATTYHLPFDMIFMSSDAVAFYVHSELIQAISDNLFHSLVVEKAFRANYPTLVHVPEKSSILNIILHAVYGLSVTRYAPTFDDLSLAVDRLDTYGVHPSTEITATSALHSTLLLHAHLNAMSVYLLAAKHNILDLAVSASPHLLSFPLQQITEDLATRMGPTYLTRLFSLHQNRLSSLKKILFPPPRLHPPSTSCNLEMQSAVARAWKLTSAYLLWQDRIDMSPSYIESVFCTLPDLVPCQLCKQAFHFHIQAVTTAWQNVKASICTI